MTGQGKKSKIDQTLSKLASAMPAGSSAAATNDGVEAGRTPGAVMNPAARAAALAGDPTCPMCGGLGYLRRDVPIDHPDFGRLEVCTCRLGEVRQQVHHRLFAMSNLQALQHLTFENFQPRGRVGLGPWQADSLERAYNQARQFSQTLNGWLLLQGKYGCGKTHLAAAIANFTVSLGVPTLFITVPDLLDALRFAYNDPESTFEERFEEIRTAPLLVMDDFGTQNATAWAQEKLFQIVNYRYINRLPLVVTTNLLLEQIEPRIRSRLEDPELVTSVVIQATDFRRPTDDAGHSELSSLAMHHEQTFSRFDDRSGERLPEADQRSLQNAMRQANEFAHHPDGWLVFTGPAACGKTFLAAAIANYRADLGQPPLFIMVSELLDHLRATFSPTSPVSLDRRFEEIRTAPLLILDDLGSQSNTPWAQEKLFQLFDYRYLLRLPTVITVTGLMENIDARLLSRLEDARLCTICPITVPNYRGMAKEPVKQGSKRTKPKK